MIKKIVTIGPESTGKSTLCQQLAQHYQTQWCQEFAREYLMQHGTNYTFEDLLTIAKGQIDLEEKFSGQLAMGNGQTAECISQKKEQTTNCKLPTTNYGLLFLDTDMYVMKVWCEYVFGQCHPFILNEITTRKYNLYLLCKPDLPWVKDELREYPDQQNRERLYHIYKDILINQNTPWVEISGNYNERLQKAIDAVDLIMKQEIRIGK